MTNETTVASDPTTVFNSPVEKDDIAYGSYAKVWRSGQHLKSLNDAIVEFGKTNFYSLSEHKYENGLPYLRVEVKPAPPEIPLIVADIIHNLRSSLDILRNTMRRNLGLDDGNPHQFPIRDARNDLEGVLTKGSEKDVAGSVPGLADFLLNKAKLYDQSDGNNGVHFYAKLDNADKHRLLITLVKVTGFRQVRLLDHNHNLTELNKLVVVDGVTNIPGHFPYEFKVVSHIKPQPILLFEGRKNLAVAKYLFDARIGTQALIDGIRQIWLDKDKPPREQAA